MLFTEPTFLFFFLPSLLALYVVTPDRLRNFLLAAVSLVFYAWEYPPHLLLLLASIVVNYALGLALAAAKNRRRGLIVALAVVLNLGLLGYYKYAGFFVANLNTSLESAGLPTIGLPEVALPLGISFFTFQALSYVVDVYRRETTAQRNLVDLTLYISLFPQLIAGPIVRYRELCSQLAKRRVSRRDVAVGVRRFTIGLGKKVLIADTVARAADQVFALPAHGLTPAAAWLGITCYTVQIYFDFSGYSDMAVGLGRLFGFRIPENFNFPYAARSMTDFWRRWHLTLSRWFRDYLYIPLGGNRVRPGRTGLNLMIVFLLCGLWHGASWNFLVWGLFHGSLLLAERVTPKRIGERVPTALGHVGTLLLVMIGWVFFRSVTLDQSLDFLRTMAGFGSGIGSGTGLSDVFSNEVLLAGVVGAFASLPVTRAARNGVAGLARRSERRQRAGTILATHVLGDCWLLIVLLLSVIWASALTYTPFIYFRF